MQVDRRADAIRNAARVREKFGVDPPLIPDLLALVGDSADGYPGIKGIGKVGAARMLNEHGPIESFPPEVLGDERRELALLFKDLATLRSERGAVRDGGRPALAGPDRGVRGYRGTPRRRAPPRAQPGRAALARHLPPGNRPI